ncbi:RR1 [Plodia interpunctella granulovirus]|uniref:RR1 n=1 Tax=Plodia interpunctella granulovirus TaxID=262175 RepID=A0A1L5JH65_9BBAC|nr:RR1 [Plodia interpunctella granulovirus]APO13996.1 RR1 [Plodia interpunctella granulovirus]
MRLNKLQTAGRVVLVERMMDRDETPEAFCRRLSRLMTNDDPVFGPITEDLLGAAALIPSSSLCRYLSTGKETPSACHLSVFSKRYQVDEKLRELNHLTHMVIKGTGVGVGVDNLRSKSRGEEGVLQNSFVELCKYLNYSIDLSVTVRKSRMALYVSLHSINSYLCLGLRQQNNAITPNLFYGLMIPNFFMTRQRRDPDALWYFFDGDTTLDGRSLNECHGEEYERLYDDMVARHMFVKKIPMVVLMGEIISCITENGFPYIIWRDQVNTFNNQRHLGTIQTLNLCAEISQHSGTDDTSMCTLMTVNVAAFVEDYPLDLYFDIIQRELREWEVCTTLRSIENRMLLHAFCGGYVATYILNCLLKDGARREIGVSPTGLFDAVSLMYGTDAAYDSAMEECAGSVSEHIYLGCVLSSLVYHRKFKVECVNFRGSDYSKGIFQFDLRKVEPSLKAVWDELRNQAKLGMANSMLTAQAPTATTSLVTNVTESVQFPMPGATATKNSKNGRFDDVPFYLHLYNVNAANHREVSIKKQIAVYKHSAPYVDQSQSVIVNCKPEYADTMEVIHYSYDAGLKTGIYYLSFVSPTEYINLGNAKKRSKFEDCSGCTL